MCFPIRCVYWPETPPQASSAEPILVLRKHTYVHVCFLSGSYYQRSTAPEAVLATPSLNVLIFGCKCVQSCVLYATSIVFPFLTLLKSVMF
jgi:hypothetical protein